MHKDDPALGLTQLKNHAVPGLWHAMMPDDIFYFQVDDEARSSCFACPKVKESGFHPEVRCCTVIPRVPNFMVGLGLIANNPAMVKGFEDGLFLPEGLIISPNDLHRSLNFITAPNEGLPSVICPFLELSTKKCGIYAFRSTTCSTYFCKTDRGGASHRFWSDFADFGSQVESALSQWVLLELGFNVEEYFQKLSDLPLTLDSRWTDEWREILFGEWFGREKELFIAAAEVMIQNKDRLFTIASTFEPKQAKDYDEKVRALLASKVTPALVDEALPVGEPESIDSLWYSLKLAARNLQLAPKNVIS